jgi:hypothetical protein
VTPPETPGAARLLTRPHRIKVNVNIDVELTPARMAEAFCEMNALDQAAFFSRVAMLAADWEVPGVMQWHRIGRQLQSEPAGAYVVREIAATLEPGA